MITTIRHLAFATLLGATAFGAAAATLSPACQARHDALTEKIKTARETGNTRELSSLQGAQAAVDSQCTDDKLKADHAKAVKKQEDLVKKRQAELTKAKGSKSGKSDKQQARLDDAQAKLDKLKAQDPLAVN